MTRELFKPAVQFFGFLLLICLPSACLVSQTIALERPGPREFVVDRARMLDADDKAFINNTCNLLLIDHTIQLVVVTIESMKHYASQPTTIEQFARTLYDQWEIGYLQIEGKPWNKGILLLVSREDRSARIELGAGYSHTMDAECTSIMQNKIINHFKSMRFSAGIRSGIVALDEMARKNEGEEPNPWFFNPWFLGTGVLFIVIIVWLLLTGRSGSFFMTRLAIYSGLGWLAYSRMTNEIFILTLLGSGLFLEIMLSLNALGFLGGGWSGVRIGSDSFSGGSFGGGFSSGGGFSGGGGATGSW